MTIPTAESALIELSEAAFSVWAKSSKHDGGSLPLWRHLDDSAAVAGMLWDHWLPEATRRLIAEPLPAGEADARRLSVWLAGVHDIGKATPAFAARPQSWVRPLAERMRGHGLAMPTTHSPDEQRVARHATTGQLLLERWLAERHEWTREQARPFAVVVGGHHGAPPTSGDLRQAREHPYLLGLDHDQVPWQQVQRELLDRAARHCQVVDRLPAWREVALSQPAQVLLTGVVIVADWIASNEELFPYDQDRLHLPSRLTDAWDALDLPAPWHPAPPAGVVAELFANRFRLPAGATPRPVQEATVAAADDLPVPGLMVIEAPMGEGKTEAALAAVERLAARCGAGGTFIALPTRATSDAMFARVKEWLTRLPDAELDAGAFAVSLAHGKARFNEDFSALMGRGASTAVEQDAVGGGRDLAAHRWLLGRKKAMLSPFVVGTIDQLLFGALKSRHLALRHLGLAGKIVIIDEAHAYDVYMGRYLDRALEWLAAYRVPTIVLSATLPAGRRKDMLQAYDRGRGVAAAVPRPRSWRDRHAPSPVDPYAAIAGEVGYPLLTTSGQDGSPAARVVAPSGRTTEVSLTRAGDDPAELATLLRDSLTSGGCALVVRNTVRRVQDTAAYLRGALADHGIDVSVAHSRFLAPDRAEKDRWLVRSFGPPEQQAMTGQTRPQRHVVVASQVAEQSLDIDFDLLVTDLAPVDLLLQRAGRLHRHQRGDGQSHRPAPVRQARCVITGVDWSATPPEPVPGSVLVYHRHPLLRSLAVIESHLDSGTPVRLPDDIAPLVQSAYGDEPVGPAAWRDTLAAAKREHEIRQVQKERRADTFRIGPVGGDGTPILGWLDANVGDADDDPKLEGRKQVRDTAAETVEVVVLIRRPDGVLITPPWLRRDGGLEVPVDFEPPSRLARVVASCTLALPYALSDIEAIEELERRHQFPGWEQSRWLAGELALVLDESGEAELHGHHLRYDPTDGLSVGRAGE